MKTKTPEELEKRFGRAGYELIRTGKMTEEQLDRIIILLNWKSHHEFSEDNRAELERLLKLQS